MGFLFSMLNVFKYIWFLRLCIIISLTFNWRKATTFNGSLPTNNMVNMYIFLSLLIYNISYIFRLYSHFYTRCQFTSSDKSICNKERFHEQVVESVNNMNSCRMTRSLRSCVYDTCLHRLGLNGRMVI